MTPTIPAIICFRFKQGGGSERYVLDLVNGFHQFGVKPTVYSSYFESSLSEYQYITPKKAKLSFIPKKLRLPFLSRFILKNRSPDEILISMTHTYSDITICGGQHKGYLKALNKRSNLLDKFKIYNEQKSFDHAKLIVAHSQLMKKELIEYYHQDAEKIIVVYPPADMKKFHLIEEDKRQALREKYGFKPNEIIYLFPSTGHHRKGFDLLKSFFEQSKLPIKLVVAGTPVSPTRNIISLGFRDDMPQLYQAADFTIMASKYEPFGLVGIESLLSGTPIIFSDNMACVETFKQHFGFTFKLNQLESLQQAVEKSVLLVQSGNARIHQPLSVLNYDPSLQNHIQILQSLMQKLNGI